MIRTNAAHLCKMVIRKQEQRALRRAAEALFKQNSYLLPSRSESWTRIGEMNETMAGTQKNDRPKSLVRETDLEAKALEPGHDQHRKQDSQKGAGAREAHKDMMPTGQRSAKWRHERSKVKGRRTGETGDQANHGGLSTHEEGMHQKQKFSIHVLHHGWTGFNLRTARWAGRLSLICGVSIHYMEKHHAEHTVNAFQENPVQWTRMNEWHTKSCLKREEMENGLTCMPPSPVIRWIIMIQPYQVPGGGTEIHFHQPGFSWYIHDYEAKEIVMSIWTNRSWCHCKIGITRISWRWLIFHWSWKDKLFQRGPFNFFIISFSTPSNANKLHETTLVVRYSGLNEFEGNIMPCWQV